MDDAAKRPLAALDPLVGVWTIEAVFPAIGSAGVAGRTEFSWTLDGSFLLQRAEVPHPAAPDLLALIGGDGGAGFVQYYFDSRGVVREYSMTLQDGVWTLLREPSPPDFSQRFQATIDPAGREIVGAWEAKREGRWAHDFALIYTRLDR